MFYVDIRRCRADGIKPVTQKDNGEWQNEGLEHTTATRRIIGVEHIDVDEEKDGALRREQIWERKLLDLTMRNNLLNMKLGDRAISFLSFNVADIEDRLQKGNKIHIQPSPFPKKSECKMHYDSRPFKEDYGELVAEKLKQNSLLSYLSGPNLYDALKFLYRESKSTLDENGSNTLFLAIGLLKWFETDTSSQPRYAPILLLPVDIIRKNIKDYDIQTREEDITFNTTLAEMLKQNYKLTIPETDPLPQDENGCDVLKVLTIVRSCIMKQPRWDVLDETVLGLFSFSKFVMWNDLHNNFSLMKDNPVISALLNKSKWDEKETPVDVSKYDENCSPADNAIPIDVDSSQLEAVLESGEGHSFILYGPPGTGKSQTITNMIANALFHGKKVLFVAEKKAALEVVQRRLEKIGLAPFCLELHSNKITKTHFLTQLEKALSITTQEKPAEYQLTADQIMEERKKLGQFTKLMHKDSGNGLSLYDCIIRYSLIDAEPLKPSKEFMQTFDTQTLKAATDEFNMAGKVLTIVGRPADSPLYGLTVMESSTATADSLKVLLPQLADEIDSVERVIINVNNILGASLPLDFSALPFISKLLDILDTSNKNVLFVDARELRSQWQEACDSWLFARILKQNKIVKYLQQFNPGTDKAGVNDFLNQLIDFHDEAERNDITAFSAPAANIDFSSVTGDSKGTAALRNVRNTYDALQKICSFNGDLPFIKEHIGKWLAGLDKLRNWALWCHERRKLCELNLSEVADALDYCQAADIAGVNDRFEKGCYATLAASIIDAHEELQLFNGLLFEELIKKYRELDNKFKELTRKMLYCRLAADIPVLSTDLIIDNEISILKRYIHSKGRGVSVRHIIDQIPNLLPRLCPVMLMSPLSVAQFIDLSKHKFDIVCFDEASQMPTPEAVGAIARGKALICVGDPKQLPPTSFFTANAVDEEESEDDDMESILEDCMTISMPERYLNRHYRSRHESLIAFSNQQYYKGRLFTFPSVDDRARKVKYVHIDGVYDYGRTRSNKAEAEAIVNEVIRRLESASNESIGIVAFSKVQQTLIEDLLSDRLSANPDLEAKAFNADEPLFVKNLENVQGDERDVILFSVGYGPDKNGNVSMNFGPLNNAGGERRLNVAVSRARCEMMVFTIMEPEMIDLNRTNALGVKGLKNFLTFAKTGRLPLHNSQIKPQETDIADIIAKELRKKGYSVDTHVGRSAFKIDIAVIDPSDPEKYILGILCDSTTFYQTKTEREREISQPSFLHHLGWRLLRVWTLDWYVDSKRVFNEISAAITAAISENKAEQQQFTTFEPSAIPSSQQADSSDSDVQQTDNTQSDFQQI